MYKKRYIYILTFFKGKEFNLAFGNLDKLRQYLVYGWEMPFDESNIKDTGQDREIIYSQDNITIEKVVFIQ